MTIAFSRLEFGLPWSTTALDMEAVMPLDLVSLFLQEAFSFGVKKALDVGWKCIVRDCAELNHTRIENATHNHFYCRNCHSATTQFTHACAETVSRDGRIGSVGVSLNSTYDGVYERYGFLNLDKRQIGIHVPGRYHFNGLPGRAILEINTVADHHTGQVFSRSESLWHPRGNSDIRDMWLNLMFKDLPAERSGRTDTYDLDLRLETRFGEVLLEERDMVHI